MIKFVVIYTINKIQGNAFHVKVILTFTYFGSSENLLTFFKVLIWVVGGVAYTDVMCEFEVLPTGDLVVAPLHQVCYLQHSSGICILIQVRTLMYAKLRIHPSVVIATFSLPLTSSIPSLETRSPCSFCLRRSTSLCLNGHPVKTEHGSWYFESRKKWSLQPTPPPHPKKKLS